MTKAELEKEIDTLKVNYGYLEIDLDNAQQTIDEKNCALQVHKDEIGNLNDTIRSGKAANQALIEARSGDREIVRATNEKLTKAKATIATMNRCFDDQFADIAKTNKVNEKLKEAIVALALAVDA